jgi:amino acid adenylation domain-containing protein
MIELPEELDDLLAGRVWQTAVQYPENPALELVERQYTYRQLYQAASSLAQSILDLEDPNPFVAIMADKSFTCYAGILGILMAGRAYLPINPRFPASRNLYMLQKAGIRVIIAGEDADEELEKILDEHDREIFILFPEEMEWRDKLNFIPRFVDPGHPAYLLFTSGTTGNPKGVPVSNRNVVSYLDVMQRNYGFYPVDRFTQIFDLTFDLSVHDMFLAWTSGACLVVPGDNSSFTMSRFIREKRPTIWFSVPSVVNLMNRMRLLKPDSYPSIRLSFFCGEALGEHTAKAWKIAVPQSRIVNLYGPTEGTIALSGYELPEDIRKLKMEIGILSIGKIFDGNSFLILKEKPEDQQGELCLAGNQVVRSYYKNEDADRQAFIIDNETNTRYYRTGDLVKMDEAGDLFFLGRKDSEVKISGYRVNLKEIENVLQGYETVNQAVVIYNQECDDPGTLLAFLTANDAGKVPDETGLNSFCKAVLPWYMVPGKFIFVDEIPLNANGKVDKAALLNLYHDGK